MADLFDEVKRVLKNDGTLWLNIGDSYSVGAGGRGDVGNIIDGEHTRIRDVGHGRIRRAMPEGLKPKDLVGIPWMLAFELRRRGWYLRADIIWHKPNPMPESVRDRPTKAHEYIFLLAKSEKYYYNADAIRDPAREITGRAATFERNGPVSEHILPGQSAAQHRPQRTPAGRDTGPGAHGTIHKDGRTKPDKQRGHVRRHDGFNDRWDEMEKTEQCQSANKRSVWTVATKPYSEAHFATFPPELIQPCILAGSKPGDIVLDPFMGSGTTAWVSKELRRKAIGMELNSTYIKLAAKRLRQEILI